MKDYYKFDPTILTKKYLVRKVRRTSRPRSGTLAMEGSNRWKFVRYIPTCRYECEDCVRDPAYIHATYPIWYAKLYGKLTTTQAAKLKDGGCYRCVNGDHYDDEDK